MTEDPKLWAMHLPGPDDVFAMASEEAAHAAVAEHNKAVAEMGLADAYAYASDVMAHNMMEEDACEGIDAFIEKRQPHWKSQGSHNS